MSPFRLQAPNISSELSTSSNPKKRRKNAQNPIQTQPSIQDLLPPPLSGYGDTIVASNPFDDCPSSMSSVNIVRNPQNMGMPNNSMGMNMHLNMCRPMNSIGSPLNIGSPMMHSPNGMQNSHMMNNQMMMNSPRLNGPMGNHPMGGHMNGPMLNSPNVNGPMGSPMHVNQMNGPMNSPINSMNSGMNGPISNQMGQNVMNGPGMNVNGMNGPPMNVNQGMNGPMSNSMNMNAGPNGPMGPHGPPMNNNFMMSPMNTLYSKPMPVSAGKVYPADQPMVFNSQNPNAPPIYPCGVCHKEVHDNDQAILCESGCNFWFHR